MNENDLKRFLNEKLNIDMAFSSLEYSLSNFLDEAETKSYLFDNLIGGFDCGKDYLNHIKKKCLQDMNIVKTEMLNHAEKKIQKLFQLEKTKKIIQDLPSFGGQRFLSHEEVERINEETEQKK